MTIRGKVAFRCSNELYSHENVRAATGNLRLFQKRNRVFAREKNSTRTREPEYVQEGKTGSSSVLLLVLVVGLGHGHGLATLLRLQHLRAQDVRLVLEAAHERVDLLDARLHARHHEVLQVLRVVGGVLCEHACMCVCVCEHDKNMMGGEGPYWCLGL